MALAIKKTANFIEIALDGSTDFNALTDLVSLGFAKNPKSGLSVSKIVFVPSAEGDGVVVRDGVSGPRVFTAVGALGTYDILKDDFFGRNIALYIKASECTVGVAGSAFVIFML
jgi:hypothetical protein